jgi:hypothetical protein
VCVGIYLVHPQKPEGDIYTHAVPIYLRVCRLLELDTRPLFIKSGGGPIQLKFLLQRIIGKLQLFPFVFKQLVGKRSFVLSLVEAIAHQYSDEPSSSSSLSVDESRWCVTSKRM